MFWAWLFGKTPSHLPPSPVLSNHLPPSPPSPPPKLVIDSPGFYFGQVDFNRYVDPVTLSWYNELSKLSLKKCRNVYRVIHNFRQLFHKLDDVTLIHLPNIIISCKWELELVPSEHVDSSSITKIRNKINKISALELEFDNLFERATIFRIQYLEMLLNLEPVTLEFFNDLVDLLDSVYAYYGSYNSVRKKLTPIERKRFQTVFHRNGQVHIDLKITSTIIPPKSRITKIISK